MGLLDKAKSMSTASVSVQPSTAPPKGLMQKAQESKKKQPEQKTIKSVYVSPTELADSKVRHEEQGFRVANFRVKSYMTDFDRLYSTIQKNGKITFEEISNTFKIKRDLVEQWAQIMEDHGLASVHYPIVGEPELIKQAEKKKEDG